MRVFSFCLFVAKLSGLRTENKKITLFLLFLKFTLMFLAAASLPNPFLVLHFANGNICDEKLILFLASPSSREEKTKKGNCRVSLLLI